MNQRAIMVSFGVRILVFQVQKDTGPYDRVLHKNT